MSVGDHHRQLQVKSLSWLRSRATGSGIRGRQEVRLADGYVADAVAMGNLQSRFNEAYWRNHHQTPMFNHGHHERHNNSVFIFEAKATRPDFLSTFGDPYGNHRNRFVPVGSHHWVVVAKGILKSEDMDQLRFWGVLVESGKGLREIRKPYWCYVELQKIFEISHALLWKVPWG